MANERLQEPNPLSARRDNLGTPASRAPNSLSARVHSRTGIGDRPSSERTNDRNQDRHHDRNFSSERNIRQTDASSVPRYGRQQVDQNLSPPDADVTPPVSHRQRRNVLDRVNNERSLSNRGEHETKTPSRPNLSTPTGAEDATMSVRRPSPAPKLSAATQRRLARARAPSAHANMNATSNTTTNLSANAGNNSNNTNKERDVKRSRHEEPNAAPVYSYANNQVTDITDLEGNSHKGKVQKLDTDKIQSRGYDIEAALKNAAYGASMAMRGQQHDDAATVTTAPSSRRVMNSERAERPSYDPNEYDENSASSRQVVRANLGDDRPICSNFTRQMQ